MSQSNTVLIVGATGKQGGKAVSTLLQADAPNTTLRFLTRNPASPSAQKLINQGVQAVQGNLEDTAALNKALAGVNRAFLVTDALAGEEKEAQQGINFVNAAKAAGLEHIVFTSVSSADLAKDVPHFRSKAKVEETLIASGIPYTILRPVAFMDNLPATPGVGRFLVTGLFFTFLGWKKCQLISTEDIGVFAGKALLDPKDPRFFNKRIDLSSGNYGIDDIRKAIFKTQGHSPWFATWIPKFVRNAIPHDFKQMLIYLEDVGYPNVDTSYLRSIHPGLMTLEDYYRKSSQ